jgi:hypothetical protein
LEGLANAGPVCYLLNFLCARFTQNQEGKFPTTSSSAPARLLGKFEAEVIFSEVEGSEPVVVLEIETGAILFVPPKFTIPPDIVLIKITLQFPDKISLSLTIFIIQYVNKLPNV